MGGRFAACGSSKRMRAIKVADSTKESELMTNTVSRPKIAATNPPSADPIAKLKDHVVEDNPLATTTSGPAVIFGTTAERAGSNSAHISVSQNSSRYNSQTVSRDRTNTIASTIPARIQSAKIITFLRCMRSLMTPAAGAAKNCGSTWRTNANATDCAVPTTCNRKL